MKTLAWLAKWSIIGGFAFVAGAWFGEPPLPIETAYTRQQADLMAAFADKAVAEAEGVAFRMAAQPKPKLVRPKTEAERNRLIAEVFMAGRE